MNERLKHYNEKMEKTISVLENEYAAIRAGRANPAVLSPEPPGTKRCHNVPRLHIYADRGRRRHRP